MPQPPAAALGVNVRVRALLPRSDGLVIAAPEGGADGDAEARDAAGAQAVDVPAAVHARARVGDLGDELDEAVEAPAHRAVRVDHGEPDARALVVEVCDGLAVVINSLT